MPLSRRKRVALTQPDGALYELAKDDPDRQVFYLEHTGEIFETYEAYVARMSFYRLKQFQCEVTGKSGLDYFQALESERQEATTLHSRFSEALKPPVLKTVQWQIMGRLDHLVEAVYERFKDRYFKGEKVLVDIGGTKYYARIDRVYLPRSMIDVQDREAQAQQASSSSSSAIDEEIPHVLGCDLKVPIKDANTKDDPTQYYYRAHILEPERSHDKGKSSGKSTEKHEGILQSAMEVQCNTMSRDRLSFSKSILRRFIRDCVDRDAAVASPWTVKPAIAKHYGIDYVMPEETRMGVESIKKGEIDKRKKLWEDKEGPPTKKQKKMSAAQEERAKALANVTAKREREAREKNGKDAEADKKKKKPIRYPTEDLDVVLTERDKKAGAKLQKPIPSRTALPFNETPGAFEAFLMSWNFLNVHGTPLHLSAFTLDEFESAIRHRVADPPCTLLAEVHSTLIYTLRTVPSHKDTAWYSLQREARSSRRVYNRSLDDIKDPLADIGNNWERVPLRALEGREGWEEAMVGCLKSHASSEALPRLREILTFLLFESGKTDEFLNPGPLANGKPSEPTEATPASPADRYYLLPLPDKIAILSFMCNIAVSSKAVHQYMETCEEQLTALRKEKIEVNREKKQFVEEMGVLIEQVRNNAVDADVIMREITGEVSDSSSTMPEPRTKRINEKKPRRERSATHKRALAEHRRLKDEMEEIERRLQVIERDFRKLLGAVRVKPLGRDRFYNRIWWFDGLGSSSLTGGHYIQYGTGRLFVQGASEFDAEVLVRRKNEGIESRRIQEEGEDGVLGVDEWAVYTELHEVEEFVAWLNTKGNRELALKNAFTKWWDLIRTKFGKRKLDFETAAVKQKDARLRSTRTKVNDQPYMQWTNRRAVNAS